MLERRRVIISMILAVNLCVLFWRMSWQDVNFVAPIESKSLYNNGNTYAHMQQHRQISMYENRLWGDGNLSQSVSLDIPNIMSRFALSTRMTAVTINPFQDDSHRLIDLLDFKFKMQHSACSRRIRALIVVHSAPQNYEKRKLIRETWADRNLLHLTPLRVLFLLGSVKDSSLQEQLVQENHMHSDMIQGSFLDDYRNLTYKHVMALKWFLYKCAHAQLLIKVDDDIFVNTPQLLKYAHGAKFLYQKNNKKGVRIINSSASASERAINRLFNQPKGLLFCKRENKAIVKRSYRSKWRVSFKEYAKKYYPPYCLGYAIVYSNDVVASLYASAQMHKFFWIDDVHVTGILAQLNGINITDFFHYLLTDNARKQLIEEKNDISGLEFLFSTHGINYEQMHALWKLFAMNTSKTNIYTDYGETTTAMSLTFTDEDIPMFNTKAIEPSTKYSEYGSQYHNIEKFSDNSFKSIS